MVKKAGNNPILQAYYLYTYPWFTPEEKIKFIHTDLPAFYGTLKPLLKTPEKVSIILAENQNTFHGNPAWTTFQKQRTSIEF